MLSLSEFLPYLAGVIVFVVVAQTLTPKTKRGPWQGRRRAASPPQPVKPAPVRRKGPRRASEQLECVMGAAFTARRLLSKSEARVLRVAEAAAREICADWRVMAQVSLGEVLKAQNSSAYWTINAKRVDLLLIDGTCRPLAAIEYQGSGHHQGQAAARDAVKKEALRRAGIAYIEVRAGDDPADLKRAIHRLAAPAPDAAPLTAPEPARA